MRGNPEVIERLRPIEYGRVAISVVTFAEIEYGITRLSKGRPERTRRQKDLRALFDSFLTYVDVLPWDRSAAESYARVRVVCETSGLVLDQADLMIAAHARSAGAILVTDDAAILGRSKSSSFPKTENWLR